MSEFRSEYETEPAALGDLLAGGDGALIDADIVDDVRKPKPKRKRKPKPSSPNLKVVLIAVAGLSILAGLAVVFIAPVEQTAVVTANEIFVAIPTPDSGVVAIPASISPQTGADPLVGQWMQTQNAVYNMQDGAAVFVLSKSPRGDWYNVADTTGNIALLTPNQLTEPTMSIPNGLRVPIGPFDYAIDKMEKLVVVLDQHGDISAGTPVYVQGWRAEDGMWIYQVSKDLVKPEYVPSNFLAWVPGVVVPTLELGS